MNHDDISFDPKTGFKSHSQDEKIQKSIDDHCKKYGLEGNELLTNAFLLMRRQNLKRFLLHSELFRETLDVPGDIAELGVYRGLGLMTWANLLECYCIGDRTKVVHGFDNWEGFTNLSDFDGSEDDSSGKEIGGFNPAEFKAELENAINIFDSDRFVPWKKRVKLYDGDICTTVPNFVKEHPGVRFSLIHFDIDLYEPTKVALEYFWEKLTRGGIMIFDEYSIPDWPGETQAVDEFFSDKSDIKIQTSNWTNTPAAWVIKT